MVGGIPSPDQMVRLGWALRTPYYLMKIERGNKCREQRRQKDLSICVPRTLFCDSADNPVLPAAVDHASPCAAVDLSCPSLPSSASIDRVSTPYAVKMRRNRHIKRRLKKIRAIERKRRLEEEDGGGN